MTPVWRVKREEKELTEGCGVPRLGCKGGKTAWQAPRAHEELGDFPPRPSSERGRGAESRWWGISIWMWTCRSTGGPPFSSCLPTGDRWAEEKGGSGETKSIIGDPRRAHKRTGRNWWLWAVVIFARETANYRPSLVIFAAALLYIFLRIVSLNVLRHRKQQACTDSSRRYRSGFMLLQTATQINIATCRQTRLWSSRSQCSDSQDGQKNILVSAMESCFTGKTTKCRLPGKTLQRCGR